jgi:hypothetical protein
MAYRADITQALTPSAPDVSGAVRAIQSQAGIAETLFGGISTGLGMYKQQMGEELLAKAEEEQRKALVKDETFIKEQQQAIPELQKAQAALEANRLAEAANMGPPREGEFQKVSAEPAFKANVEAAASRLAIVQANGGMTPSEYFLRIAKLVDEYSAKYPGSRSEIRKIVEQGSGLPGADLWAQRQFIDRLFTPPKADKSQADLLKEQRDMVVQRLGRDPVEAERMQAAGGKDWESEVELASQRAALEANIKAEEARLKSLNLTSSIDFEKVSDARKNVALFTAADVVNSSFANNKDRISKIQNALLTDPTNPQNIADANALITDIKSNVESVFNLQEQALYADLNTRVSNEARDRGVANLKQAKESILRGLDTSDPAKLSAVASVLFNGKEKNLDMKIKMANVLTQIAGIYANSNEFRAAMSNPEFETKDGKPVLDGSGNPQLTKEWQQIRDYSEELYQQLSGFKRQAAKLSVDMVDRQITTAMLGNLGVGLKDATENPGPTPTAGMTQQERKATHAAVVAAGVQIIGGSRETKLPAGTAQNIAAAMQRDINVVGTAVSNASLGAGLVEITRNEVGFRDFISTLTPEQSAPVKVVVNDVYKKSVQSAADGLGDISKKYGLKTPLRIGVDRNGTVGIIPPGKEYFRNQNILSSFISGSSIGSFSTGSPIPDVFAKYYPGKEVKPEFINEISNLAKAAQEWNNKYLPRLVGSITSRGIVMGEEKAKIANEIALNFQGGKPTSDFYSIPIPSVPTQETSTGGGVVAAATSFQPQAGDSERVTIVKREIAAVEKYTQIAKKRLERARAANDEEDIAEHEAQLKRAASDVQALQDELRRLQKGR